jgi:hypothetical protein
MVVPTQVQELIEASGNTFHARVARWFISAGWSVTVSPYYMDHAQQKARELDLIVERACPIRGFGSDVQGQVAIRLFVECKYLPGYSVFWFERKDRHAIEQAICSRGTFVPDNLYTAKHHYLSSGDRIAKLFASSNSKGHETELLFRTINQSLNGLISLRTRSPRAFLPRPTGRGFRRTLDFPVVVCNSFEQVYQADFQEAQEPAALADNFQLEVQYAYEEPSGHLLNELFVIDFVEYGKLAQFSALLENDAAAMGFLASRG